MTSRNRIIPTARITAPIVAEDVAREIPAAIAVLTGEEA